MKIYPPLGYLPNDEDLHEVYEYCEKNEIPITTHSSFAGTYADIPDDLDGKKLRGLSKKKKKYWGAMANPLNWEAVLQKFPKLKLNFGHFGGDELGTQLDHIPEIFKRHQENIEKKWHKTAIRLINKFDNVYADISFYPAIFIDTEDYFNRLKNNLQINNLSDKILFGTDWWMSSFLLEASEYIDKFKKYANQQNIPKAQLDKIMLDNSVRFLGLDNPKSASFKNYTSFLAKENKLLPQWFSTKFVTPLIS